MADTSGRGIRGPAAALELLGKAISLAGGCEGRVRGWVGFPGCG